MLLYRLPSYALCVLRAIQTDAMLRSTTRSLGGAATLLLGATRGPTISIIEVGPAYCATPPIRNARYRARPPIRDVLASVLRVGPAEWGGGAD
eukprot:1462788-Rhodomonas_salina.2